MSVNFLGGVEKGGGKLVKHGKKEAEIMEHLMKTTMEMEAGKEGGRQAVIEVECSHMLYYMLTTGIIWAGWLHSFQ